MVALILLLLLIAAGVASALGCTVDTRDTDYGRVVEAPGTGRRRAHPGNLPLDAGPRSSADRAVAF
jgi:hypothetical protein